MNIFKIAIKTGGEHTQVLAHASFQGNARSGKTSLRKALTGKKANPRQTSTGVADKPVRIEIQYSTNAVNVDDMTWTLLEDLDEETALMVKEVPPVDIVTRKPSASNGPTHTHKSVQSTATLIGLVFLSFFK